METAIDILASNVTIDNEFGLESSLPAILESMEQYKAQFVSNTLNCGISEWISVNDKLPDDMEDVLCVFTGWDDMQFQRVLSFDEADNEWIDWNGEKYDNVTHWMELPEIPKNKFQK